MKKCSECIGNCCRNLVGYKYPPDGKAKLEGKLGGKHEYVNDIMGVSAKWLKDNGFVEFALESTNEQYCPDYDFEKGTCKSYKDRPPLCRTYYCHGKHFVPRPLVG